jgi:hypothetical protein
MTEHDPQAERPIDLEAGRRAFLQAAGLGGVMAAIVAASSEEARAQTSDLDVAILNFALNLEYLEGEYYQRGVYGVGLPGYLLTGLGSRGGVSGGSQVPFKNGIVQDISAEIANDEKNHITFLRSTLGSKAVAEPAISLDAAFQAAAAAAGLPSNFNPFADDFSFLLGAYTLTEVGVTAYQGAAPFITNKTFLSAAAGIMATEAYHIGSIRSLLFAQQSNFLTPATAQISALRARLSGMQDDQGIGGDQSTINGGFPSPSNVTNTDPSAIAFARTPRQVLNVVYQAPGAQRGGFFPNGVNSGPNGQQLVASTR